MILTPGNGRWSELKLMSITNVFFLGDDDLQLPQYVMNPLDDTEIDFVLSVTPDYQKSQVHQSLDQKYELLARSYRFGLQMMSVFSPTYK